MRLAAAPGGAEAAGSMPGALMEVDGGIAGAADGGAAAPPPHRSLAFLGGLLQLQQAAATVRSAAAASSSGADGASTGGGFAGGGRKAHRAARDAVMRLVAGRLAPARLHVPLLFYAIPFMESPLSAFSADDVNRLLESLERLAGSHMAGVLLRAVPPRTLQDVRHALARALARAFVAEGDI